MPTTGFVTVRNGKYYAVLNLYDSSGKRKPKWINTGYPEKNNSIHNVYVMHTKGKSHKIYPKTS